MKNGRLGRLLLALAGNPLFWIVGIVGGLVVFIAVFEKVPSFGVNDIYHMFW